MVLPRDKYAAAAKADRGAAHRVATEVLIAVIPRRPQMVEELAARLVP